VFFSKKQNHFHTDLESTDSDETAHIVNIYATNDAVDSVNPLRSTNRIHSSYDLSNSFYQDLNFQLDVDSDMDGQPLVLSNMGSRSNSDDENGSFRDVNSDIEFDNQDIVYIRPTLDNRFKKLSTRDIESSLDKYYNVDVENKYSTEIDILTTYVRGQKHLYIQSKRFTQIQLNFLMVSSLILTTLISILTPFYCSYELSSPFISALNSFTTLIIALINYLKLESSIEKYLQVANEYDKLETSLDVCNNKLLFLKKEQEKSSMVMKKIKNFETKISEIKLSHAILIPKEVQFIFPVICHINIMTFIKKTEIYKKTLIKKLKDIKNEIRFILYKWNETRYFLGDTSGNRMNEMSDSSLESPHAFLKRSNDANLFVHNKEKNRLHYLYHAKNTIRDEILNFRSTYNFLDDLFMKEIKEAESNSRFAYLPFCLIKPPVLSKELFVDANPIVLKHFYSIGLIPKL